MTTTPAPVHVNLTRREIAAFLNVSLCKVDDLIAAKAFPAFKIGGKRLARLADVEAYNDSLAQQARP